MFGGFGVRCSLLWIICALLASTRLLKPAHLRLPLSPPPTIHPPQAPPEAELTALCVVGIKDPVRKEVPAAVATCQRAGIRVRMVTGDNIHTARHIAQECGIFTEGGVAIEGPALRAMTPAQLVAALPAIQVVARSSPQDKYLLVETLKRMGEVVAVTGDGTNDAPALKVRERRDGAAAASAVRSI